MRQPGSRVLVVEDDAALAELLARVLREDGHEVERATPGRPPLLTSLDVEEALAHACDGAADLEERLRQCFREARPVSVGGGWHRSFALLLALSVALAPALAPALARAQDAGVPAPTTAPGRATELQEGAPAPYAGSLVDRERMGAIYAKRIAAELERDALRLSEQDARARQAAAEKERDSVKVGAGPSWGTLIGVGATALVVGLVLGVVGVVVVQDRAAR